MELIDWRELYASNRAVIDGYHGRGGGAAPHAPRGPGIAPRLLPAAGPTALVSGRAAAGGMERIEHRHGARSFPVYVYAPPGLDPATPAPMIVALHGCTQSAGTFAAGALLNRAADRHGFVVAYPEQSRDDNPQACWNWFTAQHQERGSGEPARIAGATRAVMDRNTTFAVDERRVYVAGLSAGGAMAAVMAATYPGVFAAAAVHSGLAYGAARTLPAATQAMSRGVPDPEALGREAFAAMGAAARPVPVIVVHGTQDAVVHPVNGEHVTRQWLETNRLAAAGELDGDFARPGATEREQAGGRRVTRRTWSDRDGRLVQEHVDVEGLGHAWSGGAPGQAYADPGGPSAAEAIWAFFAAVGAGPQA